MMSQTELLSWTEPDTKFFADNLLGVEDWGESIADLKFDPDEYIHASKEDEQMDTKADDLTEFLTNLGDSWSPFDNALFGGEIKEEPLSPSGSSTSSSSLYNSLPSSPESQSLQNGQSSPPHQSSAVPVDLPIVVQPIINKDVKQSIKREQSLRPTCHVKQECVPIKPCNVRQVKASPPTTVTVQTLNLPTSAIQTQTSVIKPAHNLVASTNGVTYVPCTSSVPLATTAIIVGNKGSCHTAPSTPIPPCSVTATKTEAEQKILKRQQRMIKNRESACLSRRKKKEYLQSLETKLKETAALNEKIKYENEVLRKRVEELENENRLLRSRSPELANTIKKTTCVLAVVFFVALNIGPFSNLQEQWKLNRPVIPSSFNPHHGRALLQYKDKDADSPAKLPEPNIVQENTKKSFIKLDVEMLNMSQEKSMQRIFRKPKRTDLMVVSKNIWDSRSGRLYSRKMKAQKQKLERRLKKKYFSKRIQAIHDKHNLTSETVCFNPVNKTETFRINGVLEGLTKQQEVNRKMKQKLQLQNQLRSSRRRISSRPQPNLLISSKNKVRQPVALHKYRPQSVSSAVQLFREKDVYESFQSAINRKMDTFYVVSFRRDNLMFPATQYNETQRPKMSLMLLAPSNESSWKTATEQGFVPMMQIDCQVMDTKLVKINKSSIPFPYADSSFHFNPSPLVSSNQYASQQSRK